MPVYFVRAGVDGAVRFVVAKSDAFLSRMQRQAPEPLVIAHIIKGFDEAARRMRTRFAHLAVSDRWYLWSDDMLSVPERKKRGSSPEAIERRDAVLKRILMADATFRAIGREFGISGERVRQIAKQAGHDPGTLDHRRFRAPRTIERMAAADARRQERGLTKRKLAERAVNLREMGFSQREIADQLSMSQENISKLLIIAGKRTYEKGTRRRLAFDETRQPEPIKPAKDRVSTRKHALLVVPRPQGGTFTHTSETIARARALWERDLSATGIAIAMTADGYPMSKNAVIGIAHRNDFPARKSPIIRKAA